MPGRDLSLDRGRGRRSFSCDAYHQTRPPIPASRPTKLMMLQSTAPGVGSLPTSGSCGQLFVYVVVDPGRSVLAAHEVHQKNAASCFCFAVLVRAPCGMAYSVRPCCENIRVICRQLLECGGAIFIDRHTIARRIVGVRAHLANQSSFEDGLLVRSESFEIRRAGSDSPGIQQNL